MRYIVEYWDMFTKDLIIVNDDEEYDVPCSTLQYREFKTLKEAREYCLYEVNRLIADAKEHKKEIQSWK